MLAAAARDGAWVANGDEVPNPASVRIVYDTERALGEVAAKRRLLTQAAAMVELAAETEAWFLLDMADGIRRSLAAVWNDHPDYEPNWKLT